MSVIKETEVEETQNEEQGMNSARDMKVVDFACFLNRRDTTHSKKKKERKSEVNKLKVRFGQNKADYPDDNNQEEYEEDYIPVKFDESLDTKKKSVVEASKFKLNLKHLPIHIPQKHIGSDYGQNSPIKFANYISKIKLHDQLSLSKHSSSKLSSYVHEQISKQYNNEIKNLKDMNKIVVAEVSSMIDNVKLLINEKNRIENEIEAKKGYLVGLKEERNKLIAEKHLLNNELEYIKSEAKHIKEENKPKIGQSNPGAHYSDYDIQQDNQAIIASFDKIIEELEEKISNLSVSSAATKEQLENINTELKKNEQLNKQYKHDLAKQDKIIDELIKEKFNLLKNNKYIPKDTVIIEHEEKPNSKR